MIGRYCIEKITYTLVTAWRLVQRRSEGATRDVLRVEDRRLRIASCPSILYPLSSILDLSPRRRVPPSPRLFHGAQRWLVIAILVVMPLTAVAQPSFIVRLQEDAPLNLITALDGQEAAKQGSYASLFQDIQAIQALGVSPRSGNRLRSNCCT